MEDKPEIRQKNGERKAARHAIIRDQCEAGTAHETRINLNRRDIAKTERKPAVNASGAATSTRTGQDHGRCRVCGRRFEAYRAHQVYCSPRCRLMAWTCRQLVREYKAGRLPGLAAEIERLH